MGAPLRIGLLSAFALACAPFAGSSAPQGDASVAGEPANEGGVSIDASGAGRCTHLFCDDFDTGALGARWSEGRASKGIAPFTGLAADPFVSAPYSLHTSLGAAPDGSSDDAHLGHKTLLDVRGLRYETDVFIDGTGPTDNYPILQISFDQANAGILTAVIDVAADRVRVAVQLPDYQSVDAPPLPTGQWIHIAFDVRPNATDGAATLSLRDASGTFRVLATMSPLSYAFDPAVQRSARVYLGLSRYGYKTPALDVYYDNFTIDIRP